MEEANAAVVRHLQQSGVLDLDDLRIASLLGPGGAQRIGTRQMSGRMLGRLDHRGAGPGPVRHRAVSETRQACSRSAADSRGGSTKR